MGESYLGYLSKFPDLAILMDEVHRYCATANAKAINELKPVLRMELTATPKTTESIPVDFKNTIYAYSLSKAMEDGIHHHEHVKVELNVYTCQYDQKIVKPFMLVVAKDTEHASQLRELLESQAFF
ncbi:DEAD/DEAH box helicase family protein [Bartonella sp. CB169]|uniref:DEAD/DEAH box helicase family protein n=1 Tax=Bartonella sp. CB169 TaxID=3112257 RepID=UPI00300E011F